MLAIARALLALLPYLPQLLDWIITTPEEEREARLKKLPAKLKEISDEEKLASDIKDPSIINRHLNDH
jgi:hypothetical protein